MRMIRETRLFGFSRSPVWRRRRPIIKFIHRRDRSGFKGGALTEALRYMDPRAEFVVVFDADFIPPPDTVRRFLNRFKEEDPSAVKTDFLLDAQPLP